GLARDQGIDRPANQSLPRLVRRGVTSAHYTRLHHGGAITVRVLGSLLLAPEPARHADRERRRRHEHRQVRRLARADASGRVRRLSVVWSTGGSFWSTPSVRVLS